MKISFKTIVEQSPHEGMCIVIERHKDLYGSLMRVVVQVRGIEQKYQVTPSDLTTHLIVPLPIEAVKKLNLKPGQVIEGEIKAKEYKKPTIPEDVAIALIQSGIDISCLSMQKQRQGLLFIEESKDQEIRRQRIQSFIEAYRSVLGRDKRKTCNG